ncbi:MAG: helix-hairpin-helix domain-containing protein [Planctomycetota bacterium]|nr:helix-hairpin-helix domain-containing protein [Planctomycetota bacterium]
MLESGKPPAVPWVLRPPELALWLLVVVSGCLWAAADSGWLHGTARADAAPPVSFWRLDLNTASAAELEMLPGIGPRRARAIQQERHRKGAFASEWDLSGIPGLTKTLVRRIMPLVQVKPTAPGTR